MVILFRINLLQLSNIRDEIQIKWQGDHIEVDQGEIPSNIFSHIRRDEFEKVHTQGGALDLIIILGIFEFLDYKLYED